MPSKNRRRSKKPSPTQGYIQLPMDLRKRSKWGRWERRLAYAAVVPHLIEPKSTRKRLHIRRVFYKRLLEKIRPIQDTRAAEIRVFLEKRCRPEVLNQSFGRAGYFDCKRRLLLGGAKNGHIQALLTTGLVTKILASKDTVYLGKRNQTKAYEKLADEYITSDAIRADKNRGPRTWQDYRLIASLCAALVDFLMQRHSGNARIDHRTLHALENGMNRFLATALQYERFLRGELDSIKPALRVSTIEAINVKRLPTLALRHHYMNDALPAWDRKKKVRKAKDVK